MIHEMTYFQTMDVESSLGDAERYRKGLLNELNDLYGMLQDTEHASILNDLATALEEVEATMDDIYNDIIARQEQIEDRHPGQVLALAS